MVNKSDEERELAKLVLKRLGLVQNFDFMEQEIKYELEGEYGEEDEWHGTISDCVEVFDDDGKAIGVFSKFKVDQLEFCVQFVPRRQSTSNQKTGICTFRSMCACPRCLTRRPARQ